MPSPVRTARMPLIDDQRAPKKDLNHMRAVAQDREEQKKRLKTTEKKEREPPTADELPATDEMDRAADRNQQYAKPPSVEDDNMSIGSFPCEGLGELNDSDVSNVLAAFAENGRGEQIIAKGAASVPKPKRKVGHVPSARPISCILVE